MSNLATKALILFASAALFAQSGCETPGSNGPSEVTHHLDAGGVELDEDLGKRLLFAVPGTDKADSANGYQGPLTSGLSASSAVWEVTGNWDQLDSAAGLAWEAHSGLTWDQKFTAWVADLRQANSESYYMTFELTTPWGKTLPAPALECAETAMFLRATFASWYGLPFYLSAWSPTHGQMYFGHFGIVGANGVRVAGYPAFKTSYEDFTASMATLSDQQILEAWPTDSNQLAAKYLTVQKDDAVPFLGDNAYAGAYFDEIVLNKRVGHFLLRLLTNLGSMHLVDANRNTFNIEAEALRPGDVLLHRWQPQGIGHTVVVMRRTELDNGTFEAETVFGSMPRIQPKWYGPNLSKGYFTSYKGGGLGQNVDDIPYVDMGGGIKRWRVAQVVSGRWRNVVPAAHQSVWIDSNDDEILAARPDDFEVLLGQMSPTDKRDLYLEQIAIARQNLSLRPASCANRIRREDAFADLYALNLASFGTSKYETDAEHRELQDYVFAELVYSQSKTCCWNSSTSAMFDVVMAYNEQHVYDDAVGSCYEPVVFKAVNGSYAPFESYAEQIGAGADWVAWVAWAAGEACPQSDVSNDTEATHGWTDFCDIYEDVLDLSTDDGGGNTDDGGGNTDDGGGNTDDGGGGIEIPDGGTDGGWCQSGGGSALPRPAVLLLFGLFLVVWRRRAPQA